MGETVTENALKPRQVAAIAALLATGKISDAAAAGGVSTKTVYAWLKQDAFKAELRAAEGDAMRSLALPSTRSRSALDPTRTKKPP